MSEIFVKEMRNYASQAIALNYYATFTGNSSYNYFLYPWQYAARFTEATGEIPANDIIGNPGCNVKTIRSHRYGVRANVLSWTPDQEFWVPALGTHNYVRFDHSLTPFRTDYLPFMAGNQDYKFAYVMLLNNHTFDYFSPMGTICHWRFPTPAQATAGATACRWDFMTGCRWIDPGLSNTGCTPSTRYFDPLYCYQIMGGTHVYFVDAEIPSMYHDMYPNPPGTTEFN